jgi:ABC-type nitrate/sulfonate/bicarbonate transport system substrate-binding protein
VSGLVLSLQGNAITLSRSLWNEGVRDAQSLRDLVYRDWGRRTYTFAVVFPHSPQYFLLRQWFKAGGIVPHNEVRIIVLPPAQMFPTLKLGYIDGYCSGDPWTSLAADAQAGVCVATSADLSPLHPEKVLMVRRDFAEERGTEHERLIAALIEACAFCDRAENRTLLSEILAQPRYINAPPECLDGSLLKAPDEELTSGAGRNPSIFFRHNANEPTEQKAAWVMGQLHELMAQNVLKLPPAMRVPALNNVFLPDIFQRAKTAALNQMEALRREADRYEAKLKEPA